MLSWLPYASKRGGDFDANPSHDAGAVHGAVDVRAPVRLDRATPGGPVADGQRGQDGGARAPRADGCPFVDELSFDVSPARRRLRGRRSTGGGRGSTDTAEEILMERILIVDAAPEARWVLQQALEVEGYVVTSAADGQSALEALGEQTFAAVLCDIDPAEASGLDVLVEVHARHPDLPLIAMAAGGTVDDAVRAMKAGAQDFLNKGNGASHLGTILQTAIEASAKEGRVSEAQQSTSTAMATRPIVTVSPSLRDLLGVARGVSDSPAPVLIQGESGTGKELMARFIHEAGARRDQPFVAVNCAALPRDLLESELFGHERGAFTGALARKLGRFELANRGTILLDEISEMEPVLQAKLLRVLQENEVDRLGGTRPTPIDARVIATTNRDLRTMVLKGDFRRDLYYRLNVIPMILPPLRERREDLQPLVGHFCEKFGHGRSLGVDKGAWTLLERHAWPGNVRELEHVIERASLLANGEVITASDLQLDHEMAMDVDAPGGSSLAGRTVHDVERQLICETLQRTGNNRTRAAEMLGISVRTLRNKLAEYRSAGTLVAGAS